VPTPPSKLKTMEERQMLSTLNWIQIRVRNLDHRQQAAAATPASSTIMVRAVNQANLPKCWQGCVEDCGVDCVVDCVV
jgi:hypothetical protein